MTALALKEVEFRLPSGHLSGANWADAFEAVVPDSNMNAMTAAKLALGSPPPAWILLLMQLRNRVVGLVGLAPAELTLDKETVGAFPVVSETENCIILGFDDWHLDFRIAVETQQVGADTRVRVATLVNRKHWFGYLYIFVVTPFHKMISKRLMRNLFRAG